MAVAELGEGGAWVGGGGRAGVGGAAMNMDVNGDVHRDKKGFFKRDGIGGGEGEWEMEDLEIGKWRMGQCSQGSPLGPKVVTTYTLG